MITSRNPVESYCLRNRDRRVALPQPLAFVLPMEETWVGALSSVHGSSCGRIQLGTGLSPLVTQRTPHEMVSIMHGQEQHSNQLNVRRLTSPLDCTIHFGLSGCFFLSCHGRRSSWVLLFTSGDLWRSSATCMSLVPAIAPGMAGGNYPFMELRSKSSTCFCFRDIGQRRFQSARGLLIAT